MGPGWLMSLVRLSTSSATSNSEWRKPSGIDHCLPLAASYPSASCCDLWPEILLRGGAGEGSIFRRRQDSGNDLHVSGFERRNLGVVVAGRQIETAWIHNLV